MRDYSEITPYIEELAALSSKNNQILPGMYVEHHVNRGLRDMNGNGIVTAYAHLDKINVSKGQTVDSNTEIAKSGNTGRSTGPHLHFEVLKNGTPLNPMTYLKKR